MPTCGTIVPLRRAQKCPLISKLWVEEALYVDHGGLYS